MISHNKCVWEDIFAGWELGVWGVTAIFITKQVQRDRPRQSKSFCTISRYSESDRVNSITWFVTVQPQSICLMFNTKCIQNKRKPRWGFVHFQPCYCSSMSASCSTTLVPIGRTAMTFDTEELRKNFNNFGDPLILRLSSIQCFCLWPVKQMIILSAASVLINANIDLLS